MTIDQNKMLLPTNEFDKYKPRPRIVCNDGFSLSVQANEYMYCLPRDNEGPYTHVEVGFPSEIPHPWEEWERYAETEQYPTESVYGYVPVDLVIGLIEYHGGIKNLQNKEIQK